MSDSTRKKIQLGEVLAAVDLNGKDVWGELTEIQQKKDINFFTLNRYMSTSDGNREVQEHHVLVSNERYNKNLFLFMSKHPQLTWQLACSCAEEPQTIRRHNWLSLKKLKNKKVAFLAELFPDDKMADIELLAEITTTKEIKKYCEDLGWDKKQINAIKL